MIYFDNATSTEIFDSVFEKMLPFLREKYGNGLRIGIVAAGYVIEESVREMVDTANINEDHFAGYIVKSI